MGTEVTTNAIREARRSIAALLLELPEPVWREHKGVFENAVAQMVEENLTLRAEGKRLGALVGEITATLDRAREQHAELEAENARLHERITPLVDALHAAIRTHVNPHGCALCRSYDPLPGGWSHKEGCPVPGWLEVTRVAEVPASPVSGTRR